MFILRKYGGPPAFLDPDLFGVNMITGEEASIFPDQTKFIERLAAAGHEGILAIPGTEIEFGTSGPFKVTHPLPQTEVEAIFTDKLAYLRQYQADYLPWLAEMKKTWHAPTPDLLQTVKQWWEPLMKMAPTLCDSVGAICVLHAGKPDDGGLAIAIDFPNREVREWKGEDHDFRFTIQRELVETVVAQRANDWSNALFLSARFSAWRKGQYNEYLYNFFKSLDEERMVRAEAEALRKHDPDRGGLAQEEFELGGYVIERTCPHRQADLKVFGEIDGDEFVCTLHGWRFDLETGVCRNAADHQLKIRRAAT